PVPGLRPKGRWLLQVSTDDLRVIEDMTDLDQLIVDQHVSPDALLYDISLAPKRLGDMHQFKRFFDVATRRAPPRVGQAPRSARPSVPVLGVDGYDRGTSGGMPRVGDMDRGTSGAVPRVEDPGSLEGIDDPLEGIEERVPRRPGPRIVGAMLIAGVL